jgi:hypothetical protein
MIRQILFMSNAFHIGVIVPNLCNQRFLDFFRNFFNGGINIAEN